MWATLGATLVLAAAGNATPASEPCASPRSVTVAENRLVRVYSRPSRYVSTHRLYFGCLKTSGRRHRLGQRGCFPDRCDLRHFRLAGSLVAFVEYFGGRYEVFHGVRVKDMRTGRVWQRRSALNLVFEDRYRRILGVRDLVLTPTGGLAWIAGGPSPPVRWEVHRSDADGHLVLDAGSAIDPGSLTLRAGTITWRSGAEVRSAPLQ